MTLKEADDLEIIFTLVAERIKALEDRVAALEKEPRKSLQQKLRESRG